MRDETIGGDAPSSAAYEGLEAFVRQKVQGFIQEVLEEEVTALLGAGAGNGAEASTRSLATATGTAGSGSCH